MKTRAYKALKVWNASKVQMIACVFLYIAVIFAIVNNYMKPSTVTFTFTSFDAWTEIINFATLLPIICPFLISAIINKIEPDYPKLYKWVWGSLLAFLIICYRVAYILQWDIVLVSIIGFSHFIICVVIAYLVDRKRSNSVHPHNSLLNKAIGDHINNQNILSVQLFEYKYKKKTENGQLYASFQIVNKGYVINQTSKDVNCILKLDLDIPGEDYDRFIVALDAYNRMVYNGADDNTKDSFKNGIQETENDLVNRLNKVKIEDLGRSHSCLARILLCYEVLKKMVDQPLQASLDFQDGQLGLDVEKEKRLFSTIRTGLLGAILFGAESRYYFRYRRDGMKIGRKYCAFMLNADDLDNRNETNTLILVAIRENNTNQISEDIIDWITRIERQIIYAYREMRKGN